MRIIDCEQGSIEWMVARLGLPTASQFDRLLTPKTRKPSASQGAYRAELVGEWILGQFMEWGTTDWVERGTELEDEARRWYEMAHDVGVDQVGFVLRDDGLAGCSPDGLVGHDGGLEIKNLKLSHHMKYLLDIESLATNYVGQVQGCLYLTGREWWDILSYNPELPPVVCRVERDEEYIAALVPELNKFAALVRSDCERFADHRIPRPWQEVDE